MKFRITAARKPSAIAEVRVEAVGRFGNYIFACGWISGPDRERVTVEYRFPESDRGSAPEYTFAQRPSSNEDRKNFLHLFWVNNGYKVEVSPHSPILVSAKDENNEPASGSSEVSELKHSDLEALLAALTATGENEIWGNRIVLEMIKCGSLDDRAGFNAAALSQVGWQKMDAAVRKHLEPRAEGERVRDYLDFLCQCVSNTEVSRLPTPLRESFITTIGQLDIAERDRDLGNLVIRQLVRIEPELAREFAYSVITTIPCDRRDLATTLRHCFPKSSQWWIHHALSNPELGDAQAADALNCAGTAAATQGQSALAALSYEAALLVNPEAQSVAWNAGFHWAADGDFAKAASYFKRINRHYTHNSLSTRWPHIHDLPWPVEPMNPAQFTLPAHVAQWPRITVITPSFNQGCFIEETLLSVLHQGYPNLQYIVVDGNSTDDTRQVLERYRDRLGHLIIEPDKGQTEAINKGLRLADGELIAWLNSDDMYAPGALHQAALKWLETDADVLAGICIEHAERNMMLFNKPLARNSEFNPPQLARIFKYWFKGYYFYQPEVFFTKRILDQVGLLDESLFYTMDYDLWLRFSTAGAALAVVDWPFAFFRKHDTQKTVNLMDCLEEQAQVRGRHHELLPGEERLHQIRRGLAALKRKDLVTVAILSKQLHNECLQSELDAFPTAGFRCHVVNREDDLRVAEADVVILIVGLHDELEVIGKLRSAAPDRIICGWFWNSGQEPFENHSIAEAVDLVFHGHAGYGAYLRNDSAMHGGYLPTCVTRYARQNVTSWFSECETVTRNPELQGTFVEGDGESKLTETLFCLLEKLPGNKFSILAETDHVASLDRPEKDRFAESCLSQISLILPHQNDLLPQLFEALLAGQILLIPEQFKGLDLVVSSELQQSLPIIRFSLSDSAGLEAAYREACVIFKNEGILGTRRRHDFALANGMFSSRLNDLLGRLVTLESCPGIDSTPMIQN